MGLGKSIQFIYLLKEVIKENKDAKILIVCPTSLVYNWQKEFEKFGQDISLKVMYGHKEKRHNELNNIKENAKYIEHLKLTNEYAKNNKNYNILTEEDKTFKNITITILKNNHVIISKNSNPTIHFVIRHPKLVAAIESFNPLVKEL